MVGTFDDTLRCCCCFCCDHFVFIIVFDAVRCVHGWLALLMIPFVVVVVVVVVIILFLLLCLMQCGVYMDGLHF